MKRQLLLPRLLLLAVFLLLEAASLYLLNRNAELQRTWMAQGAHWFMDKVWGASQSVRNYYSLAETNRQLALENFALQEQLMHCQEQLRSQYAEEQKVDSLAGYGMIPAEVIKISRNKQHNYLILNRGYKDGIREKSGIITHNGVVGIVDAVSEHRAFAFSFQNSDISISVRLGKEGSSGLLVWDGIHDNGAILKEIPLQNRYQPGDTVFTSGHSLLFPPDIPLGVAGKAKVVNGATHEIDVTLFQDFSSIRFVTVIHNRDLEEIEGFEL